MARVTVEDCLDQVDNRFQLVLVATKRARQIANGAQPLVPLENDKPTVVALRELAERRIDPRTVLDEVEEGGEEAELEEAATAEAGAEPPQPPADLEAESESEPESGDEPADESPAGESPDED